MPVVTCGIQEYGPLADIHVGLGLVSARALEARDVTVPEPLRGVGLIDTGAAVSFVDSHLAASLNLAPTGYLAISTVTPGSTDHFMGQCDGSLTLLGHSSTLTFPSVRVVVCDLSALHVDAVIGRDVLDQCFVCYDGPAGRCTIAG